MPLSTNISRRELLFKCMQVIDTFDPKRTTVDAYIKDTPIMQDKRLTELEQKFVHQIFYGCIRYKKFLTLFVTSFLYKCPTTAIRADQTLYTILGYILFFRLDELGVHEFRELLRCGLGTDPALLALVQYAMDVGELERWVKMEWLKLYDLTFIEQDVIGKLQGYKEELAPVMEEVEFKATGTIATADGSGRETGGKRPLTKPVTPNLTKVRPRLIPEPQIISRQVKAKPVPSTLHKQTLADVEDEKRQRLEHEKTRVRDKYSPDDAPQFASQHRIDPNEKEELARKVEAERMAECTFKPNVNHGFVKPSEEAVIRQNTAAVLREDALIRKKQAKEYELLKRYEEDLHDASQYHEWQQAQKKKDDLAEEARVRQRMVEMQIAREEAMEAAKSVALKKRLLAEHQKQELEEDFLQAKKEKEVELLDKKELVKETIEDRERARIAEKEVEAKKAKQAQELKKEKEEAQARKKREEELEMEKRKDLIRQIRALTVVPTEKVKAYDPAEAPCKGLMEEMSLAELRERLSILQSQRAKELEEKRERQLHAKVEKQEELAEKARDLAKIREMAKHEAADRHVQRKVKIAEVEAQKQKYKELCVEEAWEKIERKKKERRAAELALKKELQEIATQRQFRQANADMMEAKAHGEQQRGLEREASDRKRKMLEEQRKLNEIKGKDKNIQLTNRENVAIEYEYMKNAVTERMHRARAADEALKADIKKQTSAARNHTYKAIIAAKNEVGHSANRYMSKWDAHPQRNPPLLNKSDGIPHPKHSAANLAMSTSA